MGLFEDLNAKIDEAKQASIDERAAVMAAIDSLKGGVGADTTLNLTTEQKDQLFTKLDDLTTAVRGVFDETTSGTSGTPPTGTTDVTGTAPPTGTTDVTGTPPTGTTDASGAVTPAPTPSPVQPVNPTPNPAP